MTAPMLVALAHDDPFDLLRALDEVWRDGDAALPLPPDLPAAQRTDLLDRLAPGTVRDASGSTATGRDVPVPSGTALVMATSGSTGSPEGIVLSHEALDASTAASRRRLAAADGVPWLGVLPLHHVAAISVVLRSRAAGREPALHATASADVIEQTEPSWVSLVPTQLRRLLEAGTDLARHHGVLLGGGPVAGWMRDAAAASGVHVVTSYGATETCGGCVYDGLPLDDVAVRIDDAGRVQLRTVTVATGTRQADGVVEPIADADGWWTSGDLGGFDDGRLVVHGRADDVVVTGGENVPLDPVRVALAAADGMRTSTVVGLPDDTWGTAVVAVVVPAGPAPTLADVRDALGRSLPREHIPTRLVLCDELPTTKMGKVTPASVTAALQDGRAHEDR